MLTKRHEMSVFAMSTLLAIVGWWGAIATPVSAQQTIVKLENRAVRDEADRLLSLGQQQAKEGQLRTAIKTWQYAIGYYRQVNDQSAITYTLGRVADTYEKMGATNAAQDRMYQRITYANVIQDQGVVMRETNNLASLAIAQHKLDVANSLTNSALRLSQEYDQSLDRAIALSNKGLITSRYGNHMQAIKLYYAAIKERPLRDNIGNGHTYINSGDSWMTKENFTAALKDYGTALTIARQYRNYQLMAVASDRLIATYLEVPNFYRIEELLQNRSSLALIMNDPETAATVQRYLGDLYLSFGNIPKSREAYQTSYDFAASMPENSYLPMREAYVKLRELADLDS
jgi:tetratricopeptide (TPR) repeat protein